MGYFEQSQQSGREILPDLVRSFALIGIALVNVGVLAYPMMTGYFDGGLRTGADQAAMFGVNALFLMKSYTLFAFMFGVGFAYQIASAQKRGARFGAQYTRRIIGLLLLGLLHVAFLFQGDILVMYAILGCLLYLFRNLRPRTLVKVGIGIYALQAALVGLMAVGMTMGYKYAPEEMAKMTEEFGTATALSREVYGGGTFTDAMALRFKEWGQVITFGMMMQGFGALAFFLFGLAAVKSNIIATPSAPIYSKFRKIFLPIGLIGSMCGAWMFVGAEQMMSPKMMVGMFLISISSPFSTAGYLGWVAKWAERPMTDSWSSKLKTFMARGGTATLTAYLMQGLLFSLFFNAYGFGQYGQYGALTCTLIAFAVASFTLIFTSLWRKKFERGPMEALLRNWTYLGSR